MSTHKEIVEIIALLQAAFPNYHPGEAGPDALYQLLQDLPGEMLKAAVLETCAQPGRAFAPSVGEIREAALKLWVRIQHIPDEFEAWAEMCRMPGSMQRKTVLLDADGQVQIDERGAAIILVEQLAWSHKLVEQVARMMGWPDFPGENESTDRAHYLQAYRTQLSRMLAEAGELPAVSRFVEDMRRDGPHSLLPVHKGGEGEKLPGPQPHLLPPVHKNGEGKKLPAPVVGAPAHRRPALLKDVLKP